MIPYNSMVNPYQTNPYYNTQQNTTQNGINWVQGIEGAKAYQLQPNSNTVLMDSDNDGIFYIKVSDSIGMCNLRTFRYTEITNTVQTQPVNTNDEYVRKEDLRAEVEALVKDIIGGKSNEQPVSTTKSNKTLTK